MSRADIEDEIVEARYPFYNILSHDLVQSSRKFVDRPDPDDAKLDEIWATLGDEIGPFWNLSRV